MSIISRGTTISGFQSTQQPNPNTAVPTLIFGWNVVKYPNAPGSFSSPFVLDSSATSGAVGAGGWQVSVSGPGGGRTFTVVIPSSATQAPAGYYRFYWVFSSSGTNAADIWYPTSTTWFQIVDSARVRTQVILF